MVNQAIIDKIIEKVYEELNGKCLAFSQIVKRIRDAELDASPSLVRNALEAMAKSGRLLKIKLSNMYAIYCVGENPQLVGMLDYEAVEKCVYKLMPSFTFVQVLECVFGHKPRSRVDMLYTSILYVLMRMVSEKKVFSVTILRGTGGKIKAIVKKEGA